MIRNTLLTLDATACDITHAVGWCYHIRYDNFHDSEYRVLMSSGILTHKKGKMAGYQKAFHTGIQRMVSELNLLGSRVGVSAASHEALDYYRKEIGHYGLPADKVMFSLYTPTYDICHERARREMTSWKKTLLASSL